MIKAQNKINGNRINKDTTRISLVPIPPINSNVFIICFLVIDFFRL